MSVLSGSQLRLAYRDTPALQDACLSVDAGEVVAVMGSSGSGKSTLLHCLAGILQPDSGEVSLNGQRIDHLSERDRAALRRIQFGFVFQFGELIEELTLIENVALPLRLNGMSRRSATNRALDAMRKLGVADICDRLSVQVSGGQAQRVAVARALVHGPRVVFADEPTGALDARNGDLVLAALTSAAREQGAAVVLVTHEARVAAYADREVIIRDGTIPTPATSFA